MDSRKVAWLIVGLAIGVVAGMQLAPRWPSIPLAAVATHGQDNFAICTAPMDQDVEAIFVLDSITGDLKARVMNIQARRFLTDYDYNVLQDFTPTSNPQFRLVSGYANIRQQIASGQLAGSVIYVAEVASGQIVAYGVPWISGRASGMMPVQTTLVKLDSWQFRTTAVRNP